jgi:hypothetical protein
VGNSSGFLPEASTTPLHFSRSEFSPKPPLSASETVFSFLFTVGLDKTYFSHSFNQLQTKQEGWFSFLFPESADF